MCPRGSTSAAQKLQKTRGAQVTGRGACTPNTLTPPQPTPTQKQTTRKKKHWAVSRLNWERGVRVTDTWPQHAES